MRFGQKKTFHVKLAEPPDAANTLASTDNSPSTAPRDNSVGKDYDKLGITVAPVSAEITSQVKLTEAQKNGLLITKVAGSGPAYRQLFKNQIILSQLFPTKRPIRSVSDFEAALAPLKAGDVIELLVCSPDPTTQDCPTSAVSVQVAK